MLSSASCPPMDRRWTTAEINKARSNDNHNYTWLIEHGDWGRRGLPRADREASRMLYPELLISLDPLKCFIRVMTLHHHNFNSFETPTFFFTMDSSSNIKFYNIVTIFMEWLQTGFGLVIGFIEHLQNLTITTALSLIHTHCGLPPIGSSWPQAPWVSRPELFFQLNTCDLCPYVTFSLTRGWTCHLQFLLVLASAVTFGSKSKDSWHILLSQLRDSGNLEGQFPLFICPGTGFPFRRLLRLAGLQWRYSSTPFNSMNSLCSLGTDRIEHTSPSSSSVLASRGYRSGHVENTFPLLLFTSVTTAVVYRVIT
jgi:hypothetical protein